MISCVWTLLCVWLFCIFNSILWCHSCCSQATETLFRMAVTRGIVKPIKHGEVSSKGGASWQRVISGRLRWCKLLLTFLFFFFCLVSNFIMQVNATWLLQECPVVKTELTSVQCKLIQKKKETFFTVLTRLCTVIVKRVTRLILLLSLLPV